MNALLPVAAQLTDPALPGLVLGIGGGVAVGVRVVGAVAELRAQTPGWPARRCGPAALGVVLHDALIAALVLGALAEVVLLCVDTAHLDVPTATALSSAAVVIALRLTAAVLQRRRGIAVRALARPRHRVVEPCLTIRARLMQAAERHGVRALSRWIGHRVDRTIRRCGATTEQLLPAVWPCARLRLREAAGVPRTELALLLLQAQAVMEDASPPIERMLTLLHLVHARAGCRGVRTVLEQARRSPMRHGRSGAAAWGASPQAVPRPVPAQRTLVVDGVVDGVVDIDKMSDASTSVPSSVTVT